MFEGKTLAPLEAFYGYPAPFGAALPAATPTPPAPLYAADPPNACGDAVAAAPQAGAAALVARGNCSFAAKARAVQQAGFGAMLLYNNEEGAPFCTYLPPVGLFVGGWPTAAMGACARPHQPQGLCMYA